MVKKNRWDMKFGPKNVIKIMMVIIIKRMISKWLWLWIFVQSKVWFRTLALGWCICRMRWSTWDIKYICIDIFIALKDICIDMKDVLKSLPSGEMSVHWSGGRISSATQRVSDPRAKRKRNKPQERKSRHEKEEKKHKKEYQKVSDRRAKWKRNKPQEWKSSHAKNKETQERKLKRIRS